MKFTVDRAVFLKALASIQSVADKRGSPPILSNVLVAARGDGLTLSARDMEISLSLSQDVPAAVSRVGSATVNAAMLHKIVNSLPDGSAVEVQHPGSDIALSLASGRLAVSLPVLPVADFPSVKTSALPYAFSLPAAALRRMIDRTRFAISTEATRYYLNGIYLHQAGGENGRMLRAVATDGHRLACAAEPLPEGMDPAAPGVIVPLKTVVELRKLLEDRTGEVSVALSELGIRFAIGGTQLSSKLIDGKYPDYERVAPDSYEDVLVVAKADLAGAVARTSQVLSGRSRPVKMTVNDNFLVLSTSNEDGVSSSEEVGIGRLVRNIATTVAGFQARYLDDVIGACGPMLEIGFSPNNGAARVREVGDESTFHLLMPMRV